MHYNTPRPVTLKGWGEQPCRNHGAPDHASPKRAPIGALSLEICPSQPFDQPPGGRKLPTPVTPPIFLSRTHQRLHRTPPVQRSLLTQPGPRCDAENHRDAACGIWLDALLTSHIQHPASTPSRLPLPRLQAHRLLPGNPHVRMVLTPRKVKLRFLPINPRPLHTDQPPPRPLQGAHPPHFGRPLPSRAPRLERGPSLFLWPKLDPKDA